MKKNILLSITALLILLSVGLLTSCGDSTDNPVNTDSTKGSIYVVSVPTGAAIYLNGTSQAKTTPDTIKSLDAGTYNVTLKKTGYKDTTIVVSVTAGVQAKPASITMTAAISLTSFGPVRIWETTGTSATQPSGLCLSNGIAYGLASADKGKIDLYYYSSGSAYEIRSAILASSLTRETDFFRGPSTNLLDGISSSVFNSNTWFNYFKDHDMTSYFFVYDNDMHYSKMKISSFGGGTAGTPAWVEITWIYNNTVDDVRFQ